MIKNIKIVYSERQTTLSLLSIIPAFSMEVHHSSYASMIESTFSGMAKWCVKLASKAITTFLYANDYCTTSKSMTSINRLLLLVEIKEKIC